MSIIKIKNGEFGKEILNSGMPVMAYFGAEWCGPCKTLGPIVEELAEEYKGKAKFCKLNIEENEESAREYKVMGVPTVMYFKEGKIIDRVTGLLSKEEYKSTLDSIL